MTADWGREPPRTIGAYRIERLLGEGGMGAVFLAEQDNPRRRVALKVLRTEFASVELTRRFTYEAHVLARLQHPGIAQIFEAGTFESARGPLPYFAMELIDGARLDAYASEQALTLAERVELLAKIADGVEHAHQRGVIHRDLKPGNILVDASGQPKILDFGIARATDADLQLTTAHTEVGQILGTLPYMSPEQVTGNPDGVDTRPDVYALGVLAYQLLSGSMPYDLRGLPLWEAAQVIRTVEPTRLSSTSRQLRGDLETIVGKALEKDKTRRYGSASEFAADLRRFARNEPIAARQPSALYQLRKFTLRNRALVAGAGAVFAAVVIGLGISLRLYFQAERARAVAREEQQASERAAARANAINEFVLQRLLGASNPTEGSASVRVVDVLDSAAAQVANAFAGQPDLEAQVRETLGRCYAGLRRFEAAEPQLVAALALFRELRGEDAPESLRARAVLAAVFLGAGRTDEALAACTEVVERMRDVLGPDHVDTLTATAELAQVHMRRRDDARAVELARRVLAAREHVLGPHARDTLTSMVVLAGLLAEVGGEWDEVQALSANALAAALSALGENDAVTITARSLTARLAHSRGDTQSAARELGAALAASRVVYGPNHPDTANVESQLAGLFRARGQPAEAEPLLRHARDVLRAAFGDSHQHTLVAASDLSGVLLDQELFDDAEALQREVLDTRRATLGEHPDVAESLMVLGKIHLRRGAPSMALTYLNEALAIHERRAEHGSEAVADVLTYQRDAYEQLERLADAERVMRRLVELDRELYGEGQPVVTADRRRLAQHLLATGRPSEAETALCPSMEVLDQLYSDNARVRSMFSRIYASCFTGQGRFDEAEQWLRVACSAADAGPQPNAEQSQLAWGALAQLYELWNRPQDAARVRTKRAPALEPSAPSSK